MKLVDRILNRSVSSLTRLASVIALVGLFVLCLSVLWPKPLPVIFAMSAGHVIGGAAFVCYLLAVALDARRGGRPSVTDARRELGKASEP